MLQSRKSWSIEWSHTVFFCNFENLQSFPPIMVVTCIFSLFRFFYVFLLLSSFCAEDNPLLTLVYNFFFCWRIISIKYKEPMKLRIIFIYCFIDYASQNGTFKNHSSNLFNFWIFKLFFDLILKKHHFRASLKDVLAVRCLNCG